MHLVAVAAEGAGRRRHVIGDDPIAALAGSFGPGLLDHPFGFGGKADHQAWPGFPFGGKHRQDIGVLGQHQGWGGAVGGLLDLGSGRFGDAPVGDGGGADGDVDGQRRLAGGQHVGRRLDAHNPDPRWIGLVAGARDERGFGAQAGQGGGDGVALLARRAVGDVADRIDRLVGGAAGHQGPPTGQSVLPTEEGRQRGQDVVDLGYPSHAVFVARHGAFTGADLSHATRRQQGQVGLGGRVMPHAYVHRWRHHHGSAGRQQQGCRQVVANAGGHLGQNVGGGRRHQH